MKISETKLKDCLIIEPDIHKDDRGFFMETYQFSKYQSIAGINYSFVQDNFSRSFKGVLRGLHYQLKKPQGKLVSVLKGEVYDVAVDLRKDSETFQQWYGINLSDKNRRQMWIPPGFAHGFVVLTEYADFIYKCSDFYDPDDEKCIIWNDPDLSISWPIKDPIISKKDSEGSLFCDL